MIVSPIQVPLINGTAFSFGHVRLTMAGLEFTGGFHSIKYGRVRNREYVRSNHPDPVAKTLGENEYQASAEILLEWWRALKRTVENNFGKGYGDQAFNIHVGFGAVGFEPFEDLIVGCTIDSADADNSKGTGPLVRTVNFNPLKIYFDGTDDVTVPLQGPRS